MGFIQGLPPEGVGVGAIIHPEGDLPAAAPSREFSRGFSPAAEAGAGRRRLHSAARW